MAQPQPQPVSGGPVGRALVHRDRLHQVLVRFEKVLASPAGTGRWVGAVVASLRDLTNRFDEHMEITEAEGGLFEEIMEEAPRLAHAVGVLRAEHEVVRGELRDLLERLEGWSGTNPAPFREDLTKLLGRLVRHRQKGADLLYEAYEVDLGGLD